MSPLAEFYVAHGFWLWAAIGAAVLAVEIAFGSGWLVSPSIAFSHDVSGATPSPYGNFLEDRMSLNLSVSATLDNAYRVGVSYTDFFGGGIRNKATDQDFASVTVSYSF